MASPAHDASLAAYQWLLGPEGRQLLDHLADADPLATGLVARLHRELGADRAVVVIEQLRLRRRAKEKFPMAQAMFFTRQRLEQATDWAVACYKAGRFPLGEPWADLCCGLGGDTLGLVTRGPGLAVDRDPVACLLAEANLAAAAEYLQRQTPPQKLHPVQVRCQDVFEADLAQAAAWHLDADRRQGARRVYRQSETSLGWQAVERLLQRVPHGAVKLSPMDEPPPEWEARATWEWISRGGHCRQLVAWFGLLAEEPGLRKATRLMPTGPVSFQGSAVPAGEAALGIERFLYEPDPAVLAAGLEYALGARLNLRPVAPGAVYLTGQEAVEHPLLAGFEVLQVLPFDRRRLQRTLSRGDYRVTEVKKRGVDVSPEALLRKLRKRGSQPVVLVLARVVDRVLAALCHRLDW